MEPDNSMAYKMGEAIGGMIGCAILVLIPALFVLSLIMAIVKRKVGWVISTVIFGLIGLAILAVTMYFGVRAGQDSLNGTDSGKTKQFYTSDNLASIEVPSYWSKQSLGNEESTLDAGNMFRGELVIILSESQADFETGTTLTEYADIVMDQMIAAMDQSGDAEFSSTQIGTCPALQTSIEAVIEKVKLSYFVTFVEGEEHFHQIIFWTNPSKRDKAFVTFREVAASFRETAVAVE